MAFTCKECGQEFLSTSEYKRHQQTHLQTHIDRWSKPDKLSWKSPEGMNQDLFKIFEKYRLGERAMLCLCSGVAIPIAQASLLQSFT